VSKELKNKFLLWDHDGVLVDTEKWYFEATRQVLESAGIEFDRMTYLRNMAQGISSLQLAMDRGIQGRQIAALRDRRNLLYQEFLSTKEIEIEGVIDTLRELSPNHRMAIVTTSRREDFDHIHRSRQIRNYFEFVLTVEDSPRSKPAPDPYLEALRRFQAPASEAIVIEDSERGLRAALAARLDCIVIKNEFTSAQDFAGAWRIVHSVRDLPKTIAEYFNEQNSKR
jgi:HAD superfamily hydrolase (TIGR01509 family)